MTWFGEITAQPRVQQDRWVIEVDYYDDTNPDQRIKRSVTVPLTATKAETVAAIKKTGVEVMRMTTLNSENVVGTKIPIP